MVKTVEKIEVIEIIDEKDPLSYFTRNKLGI
jgi:hypothetical protein